MIFEGKKIGVTLLIHHASYKFDFWSNITNLIIKEDIVSQGNRLYSLKGPTQYLLLYAKGYVEFFLFFLRKMKEKLFYLYL